jgi:hypothetical protein
MTRSLFHPKVYEIFSGGSHCFASTFGVAMVPTDAMTAFSRWRVDGGDHIPAEWTKSQMVNLTIGRMTSKTKNIDS